MLNVVVLNGGRGAASLIPNLLNRSDFHVTSIVNAYDDGKSTGEIRRIFGILGPSDIRKVQELMLPACQFDSTALELFQFRFPENVDFDVVIGAIENFALNSSDSVWGISTRGHSFDRKIRVYLEVFCNQLKLELKARKDTFSFSDCSLMNCIYAGAVLLHGRNIERAAREINQIFSLRGSVLPTNIENKKLVGMRIDGSMLFSESEIVELRSNVKIDRIYLIDEYIQPVWFEELSMEERMIFLSRRNSFVEATPGVISALREADLIIYAPGTQHSSLYPTYMTHGVAEAIASNRKALKVFVTNVGEDYETPEYKASDYLRGAYRYLTLPSGVGYDYTDLFSCCFVNVPSPSYNDHHVVFDVEGFDGIGTELILGDWEMRESPGKSDGGLIVDKIVSLLAAR